MPATYVVLNPVAGHSEPERIRQAIDRYLGDWSCEVYETTGQEDIAEVVDRAVERGYGLIIAAGGDGTVAEVASGLVHRDVPLGIVPVGTGNALAMALGIPQEPEAALRLLRNDHRTTSLDLMQVNDRTFHGNITAGVTARTMQDTKAEDKRRMGIIAYWWIGFRKLFGHQPHTFYLRIDGKPLTQDASEILLINNGNVGGFEAVTLGRDVHPDDGQLDLFVARARTAWDLLVAAGYLLLGRERQTPAIDHYAVYDSVWIDSKDAAAVQGDGESLGMTPVLVELVPTALTVITP